MAFDLYLQGEFELALDPTADGTARPTRRVQAVIAYLALAYGAPVRRDTLGALLWGDRSDAQARQSLRQALSQARKALGPAHSEALVTSDDAVRLDPTRLALDANLIEATAKDTSAAAAKRALQSFRGELLATLGAVTPPFDDWLFEARTRQHTLLVAAAARLAEQDREALQDPEVGAALERLSALDPWSVPLAQVDALRLVDAGQAGLGQARLDAVRRHAEEEGGVLDRDLASPAPPHREQAEAPAASKADGADEDIALHAYRTGRWLRGAVLVVALAVGAWWLRPQGPDLAAALDVQPFIPLDQGTQTVALAGALSQSLPSAIAMVGGIPQADEARFVLAGTLERMEDDAYRLFAQLEDRATERVLFTRVFEGSSDHLRGDVLRKLVVATDVAIGEGEQARFEGTEDLEAWLLASAAIERTRTLTALGLADARALYADALERDPTFANARTGLALAVLFDVFVGGTLDREQVQSLLDPFGPDDTVWSTVLVIQAFLSLAEADHDTALALSAEARALSPNGAEISAMHGLMLLQGGKLSEATNYLDRATALQRTPPAWVCWMQARAMRLGGDAGAAVALLARDELEQLDAPLYLVERILAESEAGRPAQVGEFAGQLRRLLPDFDAQRWAQTLPHLDADVNRAESAALAQALRQPGA